LSEDDFIETFGINWLDKLKKILYNNNVKIKDENF
jgi:hypothetical protein